MSADNGIEMQACVDCGIKVSTLTPICVSCRARRERVLAETKRRNARKLNRTQVQAYCSVCFAEITSKYRGICPSCQKKLEHIAELAKTRDQLKHFGMVTTGSEVVDSAIKANVLHSEFIDSSKIPDKQATDSIVHRLRGCSV